MRLLGQHQENTVVAFGRRGERTARDLLADVAKVASALPTDQKGAECLLCFRSDRYEFAVALFASWRAGLVAVLPPNLQVESLTHLLASPRRVALLHDTQVNGHLRVSDLLDEPRAVAPLSNLPQPAGTVACVLTSGSTGESQVWEKTLEQLVGELVDWQATFSDLCPPRVVASVQPGHLYGLLFTVLYPLLSGGAFCREIPFSPQAIAAAVERDAANVLVTVPVHLRATQAIDPEGLASLRRVVCSTAPLHATDERNFRERHRVPVTEIFGSTETGGVALRQRVFEDNWRPLAAVSVSRSEAGRMIVDSPFASVGLPRPYETADRIELHDDGTFTTLGRDDSVVKIGGKRVSYLEQEAWLLEQHGVRDAAVVAVPDAVRGVRLLALLAFEEAGLRELRQRMTARFGPSVIPKRFVTMHALPRGPNGKLSRKDALALFRVGADGRSLKDAVDVIEDTPVAPDTIQTRVRVPDDFVWFRGHFASYPVMAGVVQLLAVVMPLLRRRWPELGEIRTMEALKFTGRIVPGDELLFCGTRSGELQGSFSIQKDKHTLTAGRLTFFATTEGESCGAEVAGEARQKRAMAVAPGSDDEGAT